jgi:hypothetical protein
LLSFFSFFFSDRVGGVDSVVVVCVVVVCVVVAAASRSALSVLFWCSIPSVTHPSATPSVPIIGANHDDLSDDVVSVEYDDDDDDDVLFLVSTKRTFRREG